MLRLPDWYSRLYQLISEKEGEKFKIGQNDCTLFAADIVLALTGEDLAAKYRGEYKTLKEGKALLEADGYSSNVDYLEKNFSEVHIAFSNAGDLGLVKVGGGHAIVAIMGGFAVGVSKNGLTRYPLSEVSKVFKIG